MKKLPITVILLALSVLLTACANTNTPIKEFHAGDRVMFGSYEQDATTSGKEPISWFVLDVSNDELLLVTELAIDEQQMVTSFGPFTWETSFVREWLNDKFLADAFSAQEQSFIIPSSVSNAADENSYYVDVGSVLDGGKDTTDKVFLLSYREVWKYLDTPELRLCYYSPILAKKNGISTAFWWTRSPGNIDGLGSYVRDGKTMSTTMGIANEGIRPAIRVKPSAFK